MTEVDRVELLKPFLQRVDNPILSTFIISFIIWNWKFFYIIFVPVSIPLQISRIDYAVSTLYSGIHIFNIEMSVPFLFFILPLITTVCLLYGLPYLLRKYEAWPILQNALSLEYKANQEVVTEQKIFEKRSGIEQLNKKMLSVLDRTFALRNKIFTHAEYGVLPNIDIASLYEKTEERERNYTAKLILLFDEFNRITRNNMPLIKVVDNGTTTTYDDGTIAKNYSLSLTEEAVSFMKIYLQNNEISEEEIKSNFKKSSLVSK